MLKMIHFFFCFMVWLLCHSRFEKKGGKGTFSLLRESGIMYCKSKIYNFYKRSPFITQKERKIFVSMMFYHK